MILTCPSCTMRYLVAEGAVGPNGRRIKCAHCGHQWFQAREEGLDEALFDGDGEAHRPEEEGMDTPDHLADDAISFEDHPEESATDFQSILQNQMRGEAAATQPAQNIDIPEGVRPAPEELQDLVLPTKTKKSLKLPTPDARIGGFASATLIFIMIACVLIFMQPQISKAWPPSNMLYSVLNFAPALPGEGLSLANLQAKFENGKVILSGEINNLKSAEQNVPAVMASFVDAEKNVLDYVLIPPPLDKIGAEGHATFTYVHDNVPSGATNVTYAFTFMALKSANEETIAQQNGSHHPESHPETPHKDSSEAHH